MCELIPSHTAWGLWCLATRSMGNHCISQHPIIPTFGRNPRKLDPEAQRNLSGASFLSVVNTKQNCFLTTKRYFGWWWQNKASDSTETLETDSQQLQRQVGQCCFQSTWFAVHSNLRLRLNQSALPCRMQNSIGLLRLFLRIWSCHAMSVIPLL